MEGPASPPPRRPAIRAITSAGALRDAEPAGLAEPDVTLLHRRVRAAELALERARADAERAGAEAAELADRVAELELELEQSRAEPERLRALLARQELATRRAQQRLHAERAVQDELEEELDELEGRLAEAGARAAGLEQELEAQRRRADEAEHAVAVAEAERRRAEQRLREQASAGAAAAMRAEADALMAAQAVPVAHAGPPGPEAASPDGSAERMLARELALRSARDAGRAADELARAREELEGARAELAAHRAAWSAVDEVRARLPRLGAPPPESPPSSPSPPAGGPVELEPARLEQARARLREAATDPPLQPIVEPPPPQQLGDGRWLARALRSLAREDPELAGRILVDLLPTQHLVVSEPVAYDIRVAELGWIAVTAQPSAGRTRVDPIAGPRPAAERAFVVEGDLAGLARLLTLRAPRARRRVARANGARRAPGPLRALARAPRTLRQLSESHVALAPADALALLAAAIEPGWTSGLRFTIGWERGPEAPDQRAYMSVRDGRRPVAARSTPATGVTTTIVCPPARLPAVLAGDLAAAEAIHGEREPLRAVAGLLARLDA